MKWIFLITLGVLVSGCGNRPKPPTKEDHTQQVLRAVAAAGGEAKILEESRILFARLSTNVWSVPGQSPANKFVTGLPAIQSLGDVFSYQRSLLRIRVYNSHYDVFPIYLQDPDQPFPDNFERITNNVGYIVPDGAEPIFNVPVRASVAK